MTTVSSSRPIGQRNGYSLNLPDRLAGDRVILQLYSEKIVVIDAEHKKVATHPRRYETGQWVVDINHYIDTLMKKTSAIQYLEAFHQMPPSMQVMYHQYFKDNGKEFLRLVKYVRENEIPYEDVVEAGNILRRRGVKTFAADHFKVALQTMSAQDEPFREDQKTDEFLEIELGCGDILSQLEDVMNNAYCYRAWHSGLHGRILRIFYERASSAYRDPRG